MQAFIEKINGLAEAHRDDMVKLVQDLVKSPSDSGHEGAVAAILEGKLKRLGFDEVSRDKYGNVVGLYKGTGGGNNLMFNCHMDQVATGNVEDWQYPPYGGVVAEGHVHGRGAADTKGAMAAQIYGVYLLIANHIRLKGDVYLTFVIDEEPGDMWGMKMFCNEYLKGRKIDLCILGEATCLDVFLGHRGRAEIELLSRGVMSHSSAPWLGVNAVDKMVKVLSKVGSLEAGLQDDAFLGKASQAVTHISCKPGSLSTVPDTCLVRIDRRYVPTESVEAILGDFRQLVAKCKAEDSQIDVTVSVRKTEHQSYTGIAGTDLMDKPAYLVPQDHPLVVKTVAALKRIGQNPGFGKWNFGTDGAHTNAVLNIPTIGYSCCEEIYTHRSSDRVKIDYLVKCAAGVASICLGVCES